MHRLQEILLLTCGPVPPQSKSPYTCPHLIHIVQAHFAHRLGRATPHVLRVLVRTVLEQHLNHLQLPMKAAAVQRGPVVISLEGTEEKKIARFRIARTFAREILSPPAVLTSFESISTLPEAGLGRPKHASSSAGGLPCLSSVHGDSSARPHEKSPREQKQPHPRPRSCAYPSRCLGHIV